MMLRASRWDQEKQIFCNFAALFTFKILRALVDDLIENFNNLKLNQLLVVSLF